VRADRRSPDRAYARRAARPAVLAAGEPRRSGEGPLIYSPGALPATVTAEPCPT